MVTKRTGKRAATAAPVLEDADFSARLAAAIIETERLVQSGAKSFGDPTLPVFQVAAQETIARHRMAFEAGDKGALLDALRKCAVHGLVAPDWVAVEIVRAHQKIVDFEVASWDDVFGKPFPKGTHLAAHRKRRRLALRVVNEVRLRSEMGEPISEELFESIGAAIGLGKTLVAEYYYGSGIKRKM